MNRNPQIGAFFDLDGTLLAPPSLEWRFIAYLLARDEISGRNLARWLAHCAATLLIESRAAINGNKRYLAGLRESLVSDWSNSQATSGLPFHPHGLARMAWHHAQQHQIFLVTGTLAPLARSIARELPCPVEICATELELLDARWTGLLASAHMSAGEKARTVRTIAAQRNLALSYSFAYGNGMADLAMLEAVGHPVAVNPSLCLAWQARKRKWSIYRWAPPQAAMPAARKNSWAPEQTP
jgi:putative phosphoserine phosphatase / 1-acylglycerol-3-phosphate O-acyltransferase